MKLPYNPQDKNSIIDFAKLLKGKTLREACDKSILQHDYAGKGNFGQLLEKFYFLYNPNSDSEPDFVEAGLELKSSPLKQLQNDEYRSKERLVLNIINYIDVINQEFETSPFWKKNANILLVFYLHQTDTDLLDYIVKLVDEWSFPSTDLEIIKKDWEVIKQKVADGRAHELSEGDTFYLGACTKGSSALSVRKQPNNKILAKQRAYSLKQGYVNHIIASISNEEKGVYGKLIPNAEVARKQSIEEIVISRFESYYGKTVQQIIDLTGTKINTTAKNFYSNLTNVIFGIELGKEIEEFEKANIKVKSIRVESNDKIIESISFEQFRYIDIVKEIWEESEFKDILEQKFLFIFYKEINGERFLQKAKFWNMPYSDIQEAKKVWIQTRKIITSGDIVREVRPNGSRKTNFFGKGDNKVSHVRPHANNSLDTFPLPKKDRLTGAKEYTKHCFWLNNTYVQEEIYLK